MSSFRVNINEMLQQTGGAQRLNDAMSDAFNDALNTSDLTTAQKAELQNSVLGGDSPSNLLDATSFMDGMTGFTDNVKTGLQDYTNLLPELNLPAPASSALEFKGKFDMALDAYEHMNASRTSLQQAQEIGDIPSAITNAANQMQNAADLMGDAANLAGLMGPAGAIPAVTLKALSEAMKAFSKEIADEMRKVADGLRKTLEEGHQSGEIIVSGFDPGNAAQADCIQKMIDTIDGKFGKEAEQDSWWPIWPWGDDEDPGSTSQANQTHDPLILDLDGDGVELTAINDPGVFFDFEGLGASYKTAWVSPDDGIVVRDLDNNGKVDSAGEFFGTAETDAFTDLATEDSNSDGQIDYRDSIWQAMRLWRDLNQNGTVEQGELATLDASGIASISLARDETPFSSFGNEVAATGSFTRTDGISAEAWAVFFNVTPADSRVERPAGYAPDTDALRLPDLRGGGNIPNLSVAMSLDPVLKAQVTNLADHAGTISGAEMRSQFEAILGRWIGSSTKQGLLETYFATSINYANHVLDDLAWHYTQDVRRDFDYVSFVDSKLIRFAMQLPGYDLGQAATPAALDAAAASPFQTLGRMEYSLVTDRISGWIGSPLVKIATSLPTDRVEAFAYLDQIMPVLRAVRSDYFRPEQLNWALNDDGGIYAGGLYKQTVGGGAPDYSLFDDKGLGQFAYYRSLAETVAEGTAGDDILDPVKVKYLNSAGRDYTYFFGKEGDDQFVSKPFIGPLDPLNPGGTQINGSQQATAFLYREGDGNDIIRFAQATGQHEVFLADINENQTVFRLDAAGGGNAVLSLPSGGSITFDGLTRSFQDRGSDHDYDLTIRFADGQSIPWWDIYSNYTDFNDTVIGRSHTSQTPVTFKDFLFGGLGDDTLRGRQGNDTYVFRRGDGHDTIIDKVLAGGTSAGVVFSKSFLNLEGFNMADATFTRTGNDLTISFAGSPGDSIRIVGNYDRTDHPVVTEFRFVDGVTDGDGTVITGTTVGANALGDGQMLFFADGDGIHSGGIGNDAYIRHAYVTGDDIVDEQGTAADKDILRLEAIKPDDVLFSRSGDDVTLTLPHGSVTLKDQMAAAGTNAIEWVYFVNGSIYDLDFTFDDPYFFWYNGALPRPYYGDSRSDAWTAADIAARLIPTSGTGGTLTGTAAAETLVGTALDETVNGLGGDDILTGGAGSDLYVFEAGSGNDIIREAGELSSRSIDRLELRGLEPAQGLRPTDVEFTRLPGDDLRLTIVATGETLIIEDQFASSTSAIEYVLWGDGTVWRPELITDRSLWRGTAADDTIDATAGVDTIDGGEGNDLLRGGDGPDTYLFHVGDGQDTIEDTGFNNVLRIRDGLRAQSTVQRDGTTDDVILSYGPGSDSIRLVNQLSADEALRPIGTVWLGGGMYTVEELMRSNTIEGTTASETLTGTSDNDVLDGLAGDDQLWGLGANDIYLWGAGSGNDTLNDTGIGAPDNGIRLQGLNLADVTFSRPEGSQDLVIGNPATGETLAVKDQFGAYGPISVYSERYKGVNELEAADGSKLTRLEMIERAPIGGTAADETLDGGEGDDAYIWGAGQGNDTIADSGRDNESNILVLDNLLPADVELRRGGGSTGGEGYDLVIRIIATGETLTLPGQLEILRFGNADKIPLIRFADGSTLDMTTIREDLAWTGTDAADDLGADYLNNILIGGKGADMISGQFGSDHYIWSVGDGNDIINEEDFLYIPGPPGFEEVGGTSVPVPLESPGDVLELKGVNAAQVSFARAADVPVDLLVTIGAETIRVAYQLQSPLAGMEEVRVDDRSFSAAEIMAVVDGVDLTGTAAADTLGGSWGADIFTPGGGNDTINAYGGQDRIVIGAASGADTVNGFVGGPLGTLFEFTGTPFTDFPALQAMAVQQGDDVLIDLGGGNSLLLAGTLLSDLEAENFGFARPAVPGTAQSDWLTGSLLDDVFNALAGNDVVRGRGGNDQLNGGADNDTLDGGPGNDMLDGGTGNDRLTGGDGDDVVRGGDGADLIIGGSGAGNDDYDGGAGIDTLSFSSTSLGVLVDLGAAVDQATGAETGTDQIADIENVTGGGGNDVVVGDGADNGFSGLEGVDYLIGQLGNDMLDGGPAADYMNGGEGNDTYIVDDSFDTVDEGFILAQYGFGGTDTLISKAGWFWDYYGVGDVIRIDPLNTAGTTTFIGGIWDNEIFGNDGDNVLFGRGGSDIFHPGAGTDYISFSTLGLTETNAYAGVNGVNTLVMEEGNGYDIVFEFESGRDKVDLSAFALVDYAALQALGQDDGFGNSYFALGTSASDYLYMVGLEKADMVAGDFILS